MKIKTSELIGPALRWAVAQGENQPVFWHPIDKEIYCGDGEPNFMGIRGDYSYTPDTDWSQGGPIIEREKIETSFSYTREDWIASGVGEELGPVECSGPTPLVAAMRCYVASRMGEEVDIPEELK
jgi:hypothetical protein